MAKLVLHSDAFDIRHGLAVLHPARIPDERRSVTLSCTMNEIDIGAAIPKPGEYLLRLADLEVVEKSSGRRAANVLVVEPILVEVRECSVERIPVQVENLRMFRLVAMVRGGPAPRCNIFIGFGSDTTTVRADESGQVFVLGNPSRYFVQADPGSEVRVDSLEW